MLHIPKRHSLVTETTKAIQSGIAEGIWQDRLPGERVLSQQLHVSRPTLRAAFELLEKQGLLTVSRGKRRIITGRPPAPDRAKPKVLGIIATQRMDRIANIPFQMIMELRYHLSQDGFESEVFVCPQGDFRKHQRKLEAFIREHSIFCCILMLSSEELQRWFVQKGMPAFVLGSPHPAVELPSLDLDYHAASHHAAGLLLARGHRHLALLRLESDVAGDRTSEAGFVAGVQESAHTGAQCAVVRHNGASIDICRKLDRLFARATPPTGLFVFKPLDMLIALTHLLRRGLAIPGRLSLIARDSDYSFDCLHPTVAHYDFPREVFTQRLTRLMLQLVENGALPARRTLLMPHFVPGGTLDRDWAAYFAS
ncbi:MAG TPA: LacI family DNA-binding transcriptional regulator, partial [Opitutaceae bacterium]|nr:LacI family DNA-binding transcriptional regulator [Opitutaceae bacterium]